MIKPSKKIMKIPGFIFEWVKSVDEFKTRTAHLKDEAIRVYDEIGQVKEPTYDNVIKKMAKFELKFNTETNIINLYSSVHAEKEWRDASNESDKVLTDLSIDLGMRKDVFDQFVALEKSEMNKYSASTKKYVQEKIKDGKQNGLHLSEDVRKQIEALSKEIEKLCIDFAKNLNEEVGFVKVSKEDLAGCPESFINGLEEIEPGKLKVTMKYPHVFPVLKNAERPETRKLVDQAFNSRCKEANSVLLKKIVELRFQKAEILGFDTHADLVLQRRMAKNKETVYEFLQELYKKLKPLKQKEMNIFLEDKKKFHSEKGWEFNGKIDPWDYRFYINRYEQSKFSLDHEQLREYFPLDVVTKGMFSIYENLLGLKFEKVPSCDGDDSSTELWHKEVELYRVKDSKDDKIIGYFALDIFPREGKYGHAQIKLLQSSGLLEPRMDYPPECDDAERQIGFVTMVANFTRASEDGSKPSLLDHDEVVTYFHEFGHIMHALCCKVDYAEMIAFGMERDFIECPSQMLENWCWQPESLSLMSQHYTSKENLPDDIMANLQASRVANAGVINSRQVCLAMLDWRLHTQKGLDPAREFREITRDYVGIELTLDTNMPATFQHLTGGYDAQYYGYLWSEVFAADLFKTRFMKEGLLNPSTGYDYRTKILKPGGSKSASDLLLDFLGRSPNQNAFLEQIGVSSCS